MRPAARLRSPPRCINRRADRKRRGSRSRHGASCPRCPAAVLCPGRTVSGLRPAKFTVLYNSAEESRRFPDASHRRITRGFHPYKTKILRNSASCAFLRLVRRAAGCVPDARSVPPRSSRRRCGAALGLGRPAASARAPPPVAAPAARLRPSASPPTPPPVPFSALPLSRRFPMRAAGAEKTKQREGRCQPRSRERFPDVAAAPAQAKVKSSSGGAAASP